MVRHVIDGHDVLLPSDAETRKYMATSLALMQAELKLWRDSYPRSAPGMFEEARAKVEGRAPRHLPPMIFG